MTALEPTTTSEVPSLDAIAAVGEAADFEMDMSLEGRPANPVEIDLPRRPLSVYFDARVVDAYGVPPGNVISTNDDFFVVWDIWVDGPLWRLICGCWCVDLRIESIGQGDETSLSKLLHGHGCGFRCCFHGCRHCHFRHKVRVPAGTIKADRCSSLYLFAATFQLLDHCGNPAPIVGYENLGMFSFYQPGPTSH